MLPLYARAHYYKVSEDRLIINSLLPNDTIWCHDLCELSISLREFIWGF